MASLDHGALRFAMLEYLHSLVVTNKAGLGEERMESLEVAVQCMEEAFGMSLEDEECAKKHSVKPLSLPSVFAMGLRVLSAPKGAPKEEGGEGGGDVAMGSPKAAAEPKSEQEVREEQQRRHDDMAKQRSSGEPAAAAAPGGSPQRADDARLFERFLGTLKSRGFFAGLSEGTPEWDARLAKARDKFREKFSGQGSPPRAGAQAGLRERLADESKKMEEAERLKALGNAALMDKKYAEAAQHYSKAIVLWPANAVYYSNRAAAYTHMQMFDAAIADCRKAIELKPDFSKAHSRLGTAHFQAGRYQQALEEGYRRALELEPNNGQYLQALQMAEAKLREQQAGPDMGEGDMDFMGMMNDPSAMASMAENMMKDPAFMQMASGMMGMGNLNQFFGGDAHAAAGGAAGGAAGAAAGGGARVEEVYEGSEAGARAPAPSEGDVGRVFESPELADLRGNVTAKKVAQDILQFGPMAAFSHMNNSESGLMYQRIFEVINRGAAAGPA